MGCILNSVLEVVESSGTFVDPNIVGSDVEVVGTGESQRGHSCGEHNICGTALVRVGSYVCFGKARFAWRDGKEENVVKVFHVEEGRKTCKVGYLAKHLAFHADRYRYTPAIKPFVRMLLSNLSFIAILGVVLP
jgi:hypothetical protein